MDVQTIVAAEHCVDGSDKVRDVVIDNLAINAEHEFFCTVEGASCKDLKSSIVCLFKAAAIILKRGGKNRKTKTITTYNDAWRPRQAVNLDVVCQRRFFSVLEQGRLLLIEVRQ